MELKNLRLNFGCLSRELIFAPGLNLILGANEAGKSTLWEAIQAIFYDLSKAEKDKLKPWQGMEYNIRLEFQKKGKTYLLTRDFTCDDLQLKEEPLHKDLVTEYLTYQAGRGREKLKVVGEKLFGLNRDEFLNTILVSQTHINLSQAELSGLAGVVQRFSATLNQGNTAAQALDKLKLALSKYPARTSKIKLDNELKLLEEDIRKNQSIRIQLLESRRALAQKELDIDKLENQLEGVSQHQAVLDEQRQEVEKILVQLEEKELLLRTLDSQRERKILTEELDRLKSEYKEYLASLELLQNKRSNFLLWATICFPFCLLAAFLALKFAPVFWILVGISGLGGIIFTHNYLMIPGQVNKIKAWLKKQKVLLEEKNQTITSLPQVSEPVQFSNNQMLDSGINLPQIFQQHQELNKQLKALEEQNRQLWAENNQLEQKLTETKAEIKYQLMNYEENYPQVVQTLEKLERLKVQALKFQQAVSLAISLMEDLSRQTHQNWGEELSRRVNLILESFTSNYGEFFFNEKLEFGFKSLSQEMSDYFYNSENLGGKSALLADQALSEGTRQQLYLAVRAAIVDFISSMEGLPLILDEPLAQTDDERFKNILDYLVKEQASKRQIIILSCHHARYLKWLKENTHPVELLEI